MPNSAHLLPTWELTVLPTLTHRTFFSHSNSLLKALFPTWPLLPDTTTTLKLIDRIFHPSSPAQMAEVGYPSEHLHFPYSNCPRVSCPCTCSFLILLTQPSSFPPICCYISFLLPSISQNSMNTIHRRATPSTKPQNSTQAQKLGKPHIHHLGCWVEKRISIHGYISGRLFLVSQVRNVNAYILNYTIQF